MKCSTSRSRATRRGFRFHWWKINGINFILFLTFTCTLPYYKPTFVPLFHFYQYSLYSPKSLTHTHTYVRCSSKRGMEDESHSNLPSGVITGSPESPCLKTCNNNHHNKEQDRFLPIANVGRITKKAIPGNGKI